MRKIIAVIFVALACAAWAQTKAGTVIADGNVHVDGKLVQHSSNIFPGERLETSSGGRANITADGAVAGVWPASQLLYGDNFIDLDCGQVQIATIHRFELRAHDVVATPTSAEKTELLAQQRERTLRISVTEGSVEVASGSIHATLVAGETKDFSDRSRCKDPAPGWLPPALFGASAVPFLPSHDNDHDLDDISPSDPD
jgi:ferric-dicitrate binding protein FerR (iron transport regulator)